MGNTSTDPHAVPPSSGRTSGDSPAAASHFITPDEYTARVLSDLKTGQRAYQVAEAGKLMSDFETRWQLPEDKAQRRRDELLACGMPLCSKPSMAPLPTYLNKKFEGWTYGVWLDYATGCHHSALVYGNLEKGSLGNGENVRTRVHSSCFPSDIFFGKNSDSHARLEREMEAIVKEGRGVVIYLEQDGRGNGVPAQMQSLAHRYVFDRSGHIQPVCENLDLSPMTAPRAYELAGHSPDRRDYSAAGQMLLDLGIRSIRLVTSDRGKAPRIAATGIDVHVSDGAVSSEFYAAAPRPQFMPILLPGANSNRTLHDVQLHQRRVELDAQCRHLDAEALAPWKTVTANRLLLQHLGKPLIKILGVAPVPTEHGDWTMLAVGDYTTGEVHRIMVYGDFQNGSLGDGNNVMVRVHSACRTNEAFHSTNCECRDELCCAMKAIEAEGRGLIVYADQEGRGNGPFGKMAQLREMFEFTPTGAVEPRIDRDTGRPVQTVAAYERAGFPAEVRDFSVCLEMIQHVGVQSLRLMTNNPRKIKPFVDAGMPVTAVPLIVDINSHPDPVMLQRELLDKATGLGHRIREDQVQLTIDPPPGMRTVGTNGHAAPPA